MREKGSDKKIERRMPRRLSFFNRFSFELREPYVKDVAWTVLVGSAVAIASCAADEQLDPTPRTQPVVEQTWHSDTSPNDTLRQAAAAILAALGANASVTEAQHRQEEE